MAPLPNHRLLPANWQEHHRPVIAATFRSTVRLTRLGNPQGVRDWETSRTAFAVPYIVFEGPARIQSRTTGATRGGTTTVADRQLTIGAYLVALPTNAEQALVGDVIECLAVPDDPALVNLSLVVVDIPHADIAWQRSYGADLYQPSIRG